jgi:hypothetical protein
MRLLLLLPFALLAQEALTNDGVLKLVKAGLSEDLVVSAINDQPASFMLGANEMVLLKEGGVSEKIIRAMMAKAKGAPVADAVKPDAASRPEAAKAVAAKPGSLPETNGVHYRKGGDYFELLSEEIRWKTSGAMKSFASAGIIKKDLGGTLAGPSSRNFLQNPMEVILVPPQGMSINNFILLPMKPAAKGGEREFLVGPINAKSGVAKGAIAFGVEKVGPNQFRMVLPTPLGPGEYGILPVMPAASGPSVKMYTFRLLI